MPTTALIVFDDGYAITDVPVLGFSQDGPDKRTFMGNVRLTLPPASIASVRLWQASMRGEVLYRIVVVFPDGSRMKFEEPAVLGMSRSGSESETVEFEYWGKGYKPAPAVSTGPPSRIGG